MPETSISNGAGDGSKGVELGDRYMIVWRNGNLVAGDIIEIRSFKKGRSINNSSSNNSSSNSNTNSRNRSSVAAESQGGDPADSLEYYVHYPGYDRRLDEWVTLDRINTALPVTGLATDDAESPRYKQHKRRKFEGPGDDVLENKEAQLAKLEKEHDEITRVKNINSIVIGKYEIETWYYAPYPDEYCNEERLFVCEYCLKYMKKQSTLQAHLKECTSHRPPGKQIYNEPDLAMYEIDGQDSKIYCQNLCLLSKLFLDHKTLYYDVDPFLFYVLCEVDSEGSHIVGYFSKEKQSQENYNLACIMTLPSYQRKGYGKFLISVSYEISKRENTTGSPEKPLSDLGKISYRSYWTFVLMKLFQEHAENMNLNLNEIARLTGIRTEDILSTLHALNFIRYWKGQHVIQISASEIETQVKQAKLIRLCDSKYLDWSPPEKASKKDKL